MKMLSLFRRTKTEAKSLAYPDADLMALFGATTTASGVVVGEATALHVPAVGAAIRAISEAAATLDIGVVEIQGGIAKPAIDHPAYGILTGQANGWTSSFDFIRDLTAAALVRDEGGLAWVNRLNGKPFEVIQMAPGAIQATYDAMTREPSYTINGKAEAAQNVIHLRGPFGKSPLSLAREAIGTAMMLDRHASNLFTNGARPGGALKFPKTMSEDSVKKARAAWRATHEGGDGQGRTAILYDGAEFEAFAFTSTDAQFLENRKFQILEIARAFRVPPSMLFELDRATWSNTEQMGREFLSYCLEPWLRALEGALNRALFTDAERGRFAVRFDRDDLTRADLATRATVINSLIASQTINPNEGRDWLGLSPRAGGDQFLNPNISAAPATGETDE
ncbi:phage portal protein [Paracoccus sediminilitoris]|uniref:phage portal protein n=1 Tax=Paracoccus sediminilitoris TaxID=2202419 RepID=UPI002F3E45CE